MENLLRMVSACISWVIPMITNAEMSKLRYSQICRFVKTIEFTENTPRSTAPAVARAAAKAPVTSLRKSPRDLLYLRPVCDAVRSASQ